MTESTGRRARRPRGLVEWAAFLTVVTGALTLGGYLLQLGGHLTHWPWSSSDSPQPSSPAPTQNFPSSASSVTLAPGKCLSSALTLAACDSPHTYEVAAVGDPCARESLLGYLGGKAGTDVLLPSISYRAYQLGGATACLLSAPSGAQLGSNAHDSLLDPRGDIWRWCIDNEASRNVGCAQPHTEEVIATVLPGGAPLSCTARADAYSETSLSNYQQQLAIVQSGAGEAAQCHVVARGNNVLTSSLRRLRSGGLPVQAR